MFGLCKNRRNELIKEAEADFIISNEEVIVLPFVYEVFYKAEFSLIGGANILNFFNYVI